MPLLAAICFMRACAIGICHQRFDDLSGSRGRDTHKLEGCLPVLLYGLHHALAHIGIQRFGGLNMAIVRYLQGRRHEAVVIYRQVVEMDDRYQGYLDFSLEDK